MNLSELYKFNPTDQELLQYLKEKVVGNEIPPELIVTQDALFDPTTLDWSPVWYLNDNERYCLMKKERLSDKKMKRTFSGGTWRAAGRQISIYDAENRVDGFKVQLDFLAGSSKSQSQYIMTEYRLNSEDLWVLCRIKNDAKKSSIKRGMNENDGGEASKARRLEQGESSKPSCSGNEDDGGEATKARRLEEGESSQPWCSSEVELPESEISHDYGSLIDMIDFNNLGPI